MDRRKFLIGGGLLGCSAAASPLITPVAFASAPWDARLVVIVLRGAMDGLDVVRPVGDRHFAELRPSLADERGIPLDSFYAMHPRLEPLAPMWDAGELAFVHAVSTPYRDKRSHFDGQDLLEAGMPDLESGVRDGWLNRLMQVVPGVEAETAYSIGRERMLILRGAARTSSWAPDTRLELSPATEQLLEHLYHDDVLFRDASADAIAIAADVAESDEMGDGVGNGRNVDLARFAAQRLAGETRIASFSLGGWDTHNRQQRSIRRALRDLSDCLLTLKQDLGDVWGKTAVVCMTEFGRTARENGSRGTDHGTGGAMIMAGGAIRGGRVYGDWPGLADRDLYAGRDLMPTRDVRAYAGWLMRDLFGVAGSAVEQAIFPGVELGGDPRLLL
ncbi:hypothetical protein OG2516_17186 [Oceanicola granulosus HTCC2516]|uniref:Twin-arginine translocation pathway signal n=1 Tax=Oceanicola granulosus (strain ATCC BAA-861 / DSM 15982 / KCTC 12143 / HTCC2516) TaxID=314256 RepID=Q2CFK6_OCEGH|nr:DUF1501 domain-containing protein [Oceanicola granulosus]EAR51476.1 hypothetical protein OG2516_17186 [Oceanicola granulosus HTCC2516]